jgi:hypothetical protein
VKPFFPFYGSKWNMARYYPTPRHDVVIEPFAGAAGYSTFHAAPSVRLFDVDPIIVGVWSYLLHVSPGEILELPEMPEAGDCVDNYMLPQEAKWLIGFWLNRGSAQPKKSRTAYSARTDRGQLNWGPRAKARIAEQLPGLAGWSITQGSYETAGDEYATWFIDPPYADKGRFYRHRIADYAALGAWCEAREGLVITCEGPGADWLPFREMGSFKSSKGRADEMVHIHGA